jgi:hypothetical protein
MILNRLRATPSFRDAVETGFRDHAELELLQRSPTRARRWLVLLLMPIYLILITGIPVITLDAVVVALNGRIHVGLPR